MYIVGVSRLFFIVWRMVRPWLDAHTASKISFLTTEDAAATLLEAIEPAQLPACYGGLLPAPWDDAEEDDGAATARISATSAAGSDAGGPAGGGGGGGTPRAGAQGGGAAAQGGATPPPPPRGSSRGAALAGRASREGSPVRRLGGSRPPSVDWSAQAAALAAGGAQAQHGAPLSFGAAASQHVRGHSRSRSADMTARRAATPVGPGGGGLYAPGAGGGGYHRRMASEDAMSVASWASAMSYDDSDSEFFDAVDMYVEARLAEVEDAAAQAAGGDGTPTKSKQGSGASDGGASSGSFGRRFAPRRMTFDVGGGGGGSSGSLAGGALEPIPEQHVIKEVRGRLNRVRLLLDMTNVLTCIAGIVLICYGDGGPFEPQTLKVFGGVIMTVSLVSIIAGLAVSISAVSLCLWMRECVFRRGRTKTEGAEAAEEGEEAV
jgi:hypothetical protein